MNLKPTPDMVSAVNAVRPTERRAAAKCAEWAFFRAYNRLAELGDFSEYDNIEMAGQAAAAEVAFRFA